MLRDNRCIFFHAGANWLIRKMVASSSPDLDVTQDGDKISLRLHSMVMDKTTSFTVGDVYDETQQDGAEMTVNNQERASYECFDHLNYFLLYFYCS